MRVIEIGGLAAAWCGRLLAASGAEVLRLDLAPELLQLEPVPATSPQALARDLYLHHAKQRLTVAATTAREAAAAIAAHVASADVLIADLSPRHVDALALLQAGARTVVTLTPFGMTGPYRDWQATSSVLLAMGGYTYLSGDPERAPLTLPFPYPEYQSGQYACVAALVAARTQAPPRHVDVSMLEVLLSLSQMTTVLWTLRHQVRGRHGNSFGDPHPVSMYPCADGWLAVNVVPGFWKPFVEMMGRTDLFEDARFATNEARVRNRDELDGIITAWASKLTMRELLELGQHAFRVPTGILLGLRAALTDAHLLARQMFVPATIADGRSVLMPRLPFVRTFVPSIATPVPAASPRRGIVDGPLSGIRIVDFTHVWAGPLGTRILADLGAEVIKVEASWARGPLAVPPGTRGLWPDGDPSDEHWNRHGITNKLSRNKLSLCIDAKHPDGRALIADLLATADVVIDNFSASAMTSLGFPPATLAALNARLVHVTMPGYGLSGPNRDFVAFGPSVEPMTGLTSIMGYSATEPRVSAMAVPDAVGGVTAAVAVLSALAERDRSGKGGVYELPLQEGTLSMLGEYFVEQQLTTDPLPVIGNGHRHYAPHGVYRCAGPDEWIAIACCDDAQWQSLADVLGLDASERTNWLDVAARKADAAALDARIEAFAGGWAKCALMERLQAVGVPAGAVMIAPEFMADAHNVARGYFTEMAAPHVPANRYPGMPMLLDGARGKGFRLAPKLGEHNAHVVMTLLGRSEGAYRKLVAAGVLHERPVA